jgi:hypothetical protein
VKIVLVPSTSCTGFGIRGRRVRDHVGLDATAAYRRVLHDAQLAMYQTGHLRRRSDVGLVRHSVRAVKELLLAGDDFRRVTTLCRIYAHVDVRLLRDLTTAVLEGIRAFEIHEADVVEQAGATLLNAARAALAAVSAYYQRLAEQTRGLGITADDTVEETIPADRGLPGHGGPLPLTG